MIEPVSQNQGAFKGYQHPLKTLFRKGEMPSVKFGLYGEPINADNVSLEHLKPHSAGGRTNYNNLALTDRYVNTKRGSKPLNEVLTWDMLEAYLSQFNFRIRNVFDGYAYQEMVKKNCENLGIVNPNKEAKKLPKKILRSLRNKAKKSNLDNAA